MGCVCYCSGVGRELLQDQLISASVDMSRSLQRFVRNGALSAAIPDLGKLELSNRPPFLSRLWLVSYDDIVRMRSRTDNQITIFCLIKT